MTQRHLTVDAVLKLAHTTALQHASTLPTGEVKSPDTIKAIGQVWELARGRLGAAQAAHLDDLIKRITGSA